MKSFQLAERAGGYRHTAQELEDKLFSSGFEVEERIDLSAGIDKVVVGVITSIEKQEGTHLSRCVVDCGDYGHDIRITTGAPNIFVGAHVPAALDGSTLPGGIHIKKRMMQGFESNGMLCSGEELGLNEDLYPGAGVYGLLILPEDTTPGADICPVVGLDGLHLRHFHHRQPPRLPVHPGHAREVAAVLASPAYARHGLPGRLRAGRPHLGDGGSPRPVPPVYGPLCAQHPHGGEPPLDESATWPCAACAPSATWWTSPTTPCSRWASP